MLTDNRRCITSARKHFTKGYRLPPKKYYAVKTGQQPGIYQNWFGPDGAQVQVKGYPGAVYKGFTARPEAEAFIRGDSDTPKAVRPTKKASADKKKINRENTGRIVIYTDGGSLGNPGPGGYGAVIIDNRRRELSAGYRLTTNNRMELMGALVGLRAVPAGSRVLLHSDSKYLVDGITRGWAAKWRRCGWKKSDGQPALNTDLWKSLLDLVAERDVIFRWVKGHAGNPENECCDQLAKAAAAGEDLLQDSGYVTGKPLP